MSTPIGPDNLRALEQFVAAHRGWTVVEHRDQVHGSRRYDFPGGQRVLLSVKPLSAERGGTSAVPLERRISRWWTAQLSVPFSAGPAVSADGRLDEVAAWLRAQDKALAFVEVMHHARTFDEAVAVAGALRAEQRHTIAAALETQARPEQLAVACRPGERREALHGARKGGR